MKHHETLQHSPFDATTSAVDATISAVDATSAVDVETSALGAAISVLARSFRQYPSGVYSDCRVGITLQMCNRVTNHGDIGTFSKPA